MARTKHIAMKKQRTRRHPAATPSPSAPPATASRRRRDAPESKRDKQSFRAKHSTLAG
ncbi:hypothetical protein Ancab_036869 [Ancistrocladus abbreviatus]